MPRYLLFTVPWLFPPLGLCSHISFTEFPSLQTSARIPHLPGQAGCQIHPNALQGPPRPSTETHFSISTQSELDMDHMLIVFYVVLFSQWVSCLIEGCLNGPVPSVSPDGFLSVLDKKSHTANTRVAPTWLRCAFKGAARPGSHGRPLPSDRRAGAHDAEASHRSCQWPWGFMVYDCGAHMDIVVYNLS